jgi:hypothetical protein
MMKRAGAEEMPEELKPRDDIVSRLEHADSRLKSLRLKAGQIQTRNFTHLQEDIELLQLERDSIQQEAQNPHQTEATAGEALQVALTEALDALLGKIESMRRKLSDSDEESEQE